jgi:uncharacterized protein
MPAHGTFVWNELHTRDVERAKRFYADTLGWTYDGMPMPDGSGTYWVAKAGEAFAGGLFDIRDHRFDGMPEHWLCYIETDDVDARCAKAKAAGGQVYREPWDIPGVGRIAILGDPGGAGIGFMTSASRQA